jgi:hypothetical protein
MEISKKPKEPEYELVVKVTKKEWDLIEGIGENLFKEAGAGSGCRADRLICLRATIRVIVEE